MQHVRLLSSRQVRPLMCHLSDGLMREIMAYLVLNNCNFLFPYLKAVF